MSMTRRQFVLSGGLLVPAVSGLLTRTHAQSLLLSKSAAFREYNFAGQGTLAAWYAPRKETTYANNDPLTLNDWSGNGRHATGSGSTRPLYITGVQNGLPSARFDGVDDVLTTASVDWTRDITVFCVFKFITKTVDFARVVEIGANNHYGIAHWTGSVGEANLQWGFTDNVIDSGYNTFSTSTFVGTSTTGTWWQNGVSVGSNPTVSPTTGSKVLTFANFGGGGSYYGNIDLLELIIYTGTVSDRAAVEAALRAIYAHY